ncbi:MAG: hypothetical protein ACRCUE_09550 [Bosea sp. (in: a-proteobacteria)]
MMTAGDVWPWIGTVVAGVALVVAAAIAWLAILRWLIVIVPAIVLVSFAFAPELQLRFTATLLGALALLICRRWRLRGSGVRSQACAQRPSPKPVRLQPWNWPIRCLPTKRPATGWTGKAKSPERSASGTTATAVRVIWNDRGWSACGADSSRSTDGGTRGLA